MTINPPDDLRDPDPTPRPDHCCGVCPPIKRGGYDCTCRDNPRCPTTKENA